MLLAPDHTEGNLGLLEVKAVLQSKQQSQGSNLDLFYFFLQSLCCVHSEPPGFMVPLLDETKFAGIGI